MTQISYSHPKQTQKVTLFNLKENSLGNEKAKQRSAKENEKGYWAHCLGTRCR